MADRFIKGRGTQMHVPNPFDQLHYSTDDLAGIDEITTPRPQTKFFFESVKKIISKSESPDLGVMHSLNPYQGCEHGCIYCACCTTKGS